MDKKSRIMIIFSVVCLIIAITALTYAYFSARVTGLESASTISLSAGTMGIHYAEGNGNINTGNNIYPRAEAWATKTFTLTGNNTTNQTMDFEVGLNIITNTFKGGQLSFSLEANDNNDGTSMSEVSYKSITKTSGTMFIGRGSFPGPVTDGVQEYTLKIYFLDTGKNQNINQGAVFNANITVQEKGSILAVNECIDTAHPTLTQGDEYVNGQYTYRYMQDWYYDEGWDTFDDLNLDGWGVVLTDSLNNHGDSTSAINTIPCTSINGKPVVSMQSMFWNSHASSVDFSAYNTSDVVSMYGMFEEAHISSLDLSSFDTSNVINMNSMFYFSTTTSIDLSSFDTSNVTDMVDMFADSAATSLDLSSFDTSSVTDMSEMFAGSAATTFNLSSFDTSNVTSMHSMFANTVVTTLDVSLFNTSNVTDMGSMFEGSTAIQILGLNKFDTSNVTSMWAMFENSAVTTLDLSTFDTSNVTSMALMFKESAATTLDISSFDTSSVTIMYRMFYNSTNLETIYVSDEFNISNLATDGTFSGSTDMFKGCTSLVGGSGTVYNSSKINKEYARIDNPPNSPGYFTRK